MAPGEGAASLSALSGQPQVLASQRLRYAVLFAVRLCGRTRIRPQWVRQAAGLVEPRRLRRAAALNVLDEEVT